jgi:RNA polymerase sigma factor (sigma-70 family)
MSFRGRLDSLMHRLRRAVAPATDGASDAALLARFIAARDETAFELLLWRHGPMVLSTCRRMLRCDQDAEDAFQAAFLLLARKAASIRRGEAVAGWLHRTACRIALRARESARKRPVAVPPGAEPTAPSAEPDAGWRELRPILDEEVHRLPQKYRLAIILCYFQGRTHAEAARELGCPRGTVGVRLQRAREILRGRLTRRGLALSATALAVLAAERTASAAAPAAIVQATLKAAWLFGAGKAVAGAASTQAVAWTQGVLRTMFLSKVKWAAVVVLLVAIVGTGTGYMMSLHAAPPRALAVAAAPPVAAPGDDGKAAVDVPSEPEGRLLLVGTEIKPGENVAGSDKVSAEVGFLAVELGDRADPNLKNIAPQKWWAELDKSGAKAYGRWKVGDPLPPGKLFVVREEREYRKLHVGDATEQGQLLAVVDEEPALHDVDAKLAALEKAEAEYTAAGKTKDEAVRRAKQSERLQEKNAGAITADEYLADQLTRDRFIEEEKAKDAARRAATAQLRASLSLLVAHEIRSLDRGVVTAILKHRGEAIHHLEPVVRLEVADGPAAPAENPAEKPADKPATTAQPVVPLLHVGSQRDGILLVVGTEIKEGEKVPADRVVTIKTDGGEKKYRRLREGDLVEEGQLLARLDDRLARLDVQVQQIKLESAEAALGAAVKLREGAARRSQRLSELSGKLAVAEEEVQTAKLDLERAAADEQVKAATVKQAQVELKAGQTMLEMYEIRSPIRGVIRAVLKDRGEAVRSLDTVVEIEEKKD